MSIGTTNFLWFSSMVGKAPTKIICPGARPLNTRIPNVAEKYTASLERLIIKHRLINRMGKVHESDWGDVWRTRALNKINKEGANYMKAAENGCRKIRAGKIPLSPTAAKWLRKLQIYHSLLQHQAGQIKNWRNLAHSAHRAGIADPLSLSMDQLQAHMTVCLRKSEVLQKAGWLERHRFLWEKCSEA